MSKIIVQHEAQNIRGFCGLLPATFNDLTPAQLVYLPQTTGTGSHILWNAGHIIWSISEDVGVTIGLPSNLPSRYTDLFAPETQPLANPADYPSITELAEMTEETAERVATFLISLEDEILTTPIPEENPLSAIYPNWLELISSTGFHIGYHIGQIGLLRKLQGLTPALR
jgi:hypothetical protein